VKEVVQSEAGRADSGCGVLGDGKAVFLYFEVSRQLMLLR